MKTWINKKTMQGRTVRIRSALLLFWLLVLAGCGGAQPPQDAVSTQAGAKGVYSESAAGGDLAGGGQSETMADASDMSLAGGSGEAASHVSDGERALPDPESGLTMEFMDVGQGDSTLILCEGEAMLIDAGDESAGTNVQNELQKLGVEDLKYFVCTHPDADHIGGADVIAYKFPVGALLMPELERDTKAYEQLADSIVERDIKVIHPAVGEAYDLGGGSFTIVGPVEQYDREDPNDWSVCLRFTYGELSFLFCGDAEEKAEEDMLAAGVPLEADVYHVSHHGSSSSTTEAFLQAVEPSYGVVSCGRDNDYGHPHRETREALAARQVQLYRTDELGNIFCYSDGKLLNWESEYGFGGENGAAAEKAAEEDASWTDGAAPEEGSVSEESAALESPGQDYVLNTNTMKIHLPECESVTQMKAKNRQKVHAALEDLMEEGYVPCKNCMG